MTALAAFVVAHGSEIEVSGRRFTVEDVSGDRDLALATLRAGRGTYTGVVAVRRDLVSGKPGAEVWSVMSGRRTVARFAIWEDAVYPLR